MDQELPPSPWEYFASMVESYDSLIRRAVPRYEEMIAGLLEYLPHDTRSLVELGCGTGNLSLELLAKFPRGTLSFVDASPEMIALTRSRIDKAIGPTNPPIAFLVQRFEELELPEGPVDLVVSSISLHHVEDKAGLYSRVRSCLNLGGRFCFADQLRGEPESNHRLNWERWLDHCREPGHCTPGEIESLVEHATAHDHYTTVSDHLVLLSKAGFSEMDCVWRNGMWGIVTATAS
ncbi:MAG: tRNA (cmo5U34)-methyltransferase [Gemmatimonadaceae bacterium]|jgi:ubiquinone/menaquinone biosynthesis C-methylase UbiE|nr:tRNA (cmo5U34)-methyltransferase [Gemmatimonadaceae bacterium]